MVDNLYWLDQIQPSDRSFVGDRALNLNHLLQRGYPVLPGFVVPAIAFWEFIEVLGKSEPLLADLPHSSLYVNVDDPRQLQLVAQRIRQTITAAALPSVWRGLLLTAAEILPAPVIILQPSLSLPSKRSLMRRLQVENLMNQGQIVGLLESYSCLKEADALVSILKQVWAELFRARSLFYWQRVGIGLHQINFAVLVQPIYDAIASGTLYATSDEWQIQATWGLGLTIAKGEVLPDSYQIEANTGKVLTSELGSKTLAYRLGNELDQPLLAYPLSEEEQNRYALDERYLQQLIELRQQLNTELSTPFAFDWSVCQIPGTEQPQLYITEFSRQSSLLSQPPTPNPMPDRVRGIPAASGRITALAQVIGEDRPNLEIIPPGRILVAQSFAPDWLPWLRQAAGVVTEQGGMTSHAAIVARELGIPAVVSVTDVTELIQTDELLLVDGDRGEVQRLGLSGVSDQSSVATIEGSENEIRDKGQFTMDNGQRTTDKFPIATQLLVNLSQVQSLARIGNLPVDGVGLLRSELMILDALEHLHPNEWLRQGRQRELVERFAQLIVQFAAAFMPRPVLYRSLDWREAELSGDIQTFKSDSLSSPQPAHSMLSQGGTHRYLHDPACFDLELAALGRVYASGNTNVQLMLPFVRTVEEFAFCRRRVEQAGLMDNPHFRLWIMAEVPSVLFLLPDYVKAGVQGISIGTNDLTQLLLATDRNYGELSSTLDGRHPAVMRAIKQLIEMARAEGIPCSICGQAPALYPELIERLVEWGITSISVDVNDVERIYYAIARAEQRLLLEAARKKINY